MTKIVSDMSTEIADIFTIPWHIQRKYCDDESFRESMVSTIINEILNSEDEKINKETKDLLVSITDIKELYYWVLDYLLLNGRIR